MSLHHLCLTQAGFSRLYFQIRITPLSFSTMLRFLCAVILCASGVASTVLVDSYSKAIGGGGGISFASNGTGRITGVMAWEDANYTHCITGIQLRYGYNWSNRLGHAAGLEQQIELFDEESIVQLSGKYDFFGSIYQLIFVTSRGRSFIVGQAYQASFNFYPLHPDAELLMLSGRYNGYCITSLAAHWGKDTDENSTYNKKPADY